MTHSLSAALVLLSAFLHAVWNLQAKKTPYKGAFLWLITAFGSILLLPVVVLREGKLITWELRHWLFPVLSILSHALYSFSLAESYRRVPFSVAYPVSRGLAQVFIVLVGLAIFGERPEPWALFGVALILTGIQATAEGTLRERLGLLCQSPWPLLVAFTICLYTAIDHRSVQVLPPLTVCLVSNIGQCLLLARLQLGEFRRISHQERGPLLRQTILWGAVATAGYSLFLYAQHIGGMISLVGPLRETSVLMGMILSFFVLNETFHMRKLMAAILIVAGIVLIRS